MMIIARICILWYLNAQTTTIGSRDYGITHPESWAVNLDYALRLISITKDHNMSADEAILWTKNGSSLGSLALGSTWTWTVRQNNLIPL